jgi:hypothetical protein
MNVFVLCTGRCGSVTFAEACKQIRNYTCGHETQAGFVGPARIEYPDNHIEVDNRLSWYLGRLHFKYGSTAFYVHLKRSMDATARSYARRRYVGVMNAFASGLLRQKTLSADAQDPVKLAAEICDTMQANIRHFLLDKPNKLEIQLETIETDFPVFWNRIAAEGDLSRALQCFDNRANSSREFEQHVSRIGGLTRLRRALKAAWRSFEAPNRDTSFFDR